MELKLVNSNDPILFNESKLFDFSNPPFNIIEFSQSLVEKMKDKNGYGLAAPQVGYPYKIFAIEGNPAKVIINPRIIELSEKTVLMEEGCLSYPGLYIKIRRPETVKIRFTYPDGQSKTELYNGLTARVIQHEYDHLIGVCHINRATAFHKEQAMRKWKQLKRKAKGLLIKENIA